MVVALDGEADARRRCVSRADLASHLLTMWGTVMGNMQTSDHRTQLAWMRAPPRADVERGAGHSVPASSAPRRPRPCSCVCCAECVRVRHPLRCGGSDVEPLRSWSRASAEPADCQRAPGRQLQRVRPFESISRACGVWCV